jgi:sulfofructose kinase
LGGAASFIGCVGDDATGDRIVEGLAEAGIEIDAVRRVAGVASPLSSVLVDSEGERLIVNHVGEGLFEGGAPVTPGELAQSEAVLVDMRWPEGAIAALAAARARGIPAIVDCDHDPTTDRGGEILNAATHVVFSLPTLQEFTGAADAVGALRGASAHTDAWVAATAGPAGVFWLEDDTIRHEPAFPVQVVDTLGAGDVFHGAFALALAENASLERAVRFGSAAAALKCTRPGGRDGIPNRAEVESLIKESEL